MPASMAANCAWRSGSTVADEPSFSHAARLGMRRAAYHMLKAGWEVLSAVEALLDELGRRGGDEERQRIDVEADDEGPQRIPVD